MVTIGNHCYRVVPLVISWLISSHLTIIISTITIMVTLLISKGVVPRLVISWISHWSMILSTISSCPSYIHQRIALRIGGPPTLFAQIPRPTSPATVVLHEGVVPLLCHAVQQFHCLGPKPSRPRCGNPGWGWLPIYLPIGNLKGRVK